MDKMSADIETLYSHKALAESRSRVETCITKLRWAIQQNLPAGAAALLRTVRIDHPDIGAHQELLDFYALNNVITMPLLSLVFLEDISTVYAWLATNKYSVETVQDYLTMLKYKVSDEFDGRRYPPPLTALGVPQNALSDSKVDDLSLRFRNTAYAFILGHELGHLYLRHPAYHPGRGNPQIRANEQAADVFALEVMRQTAEIPFGAMLFFLTAAYYYPTRADFRTEKQWNDFLDSSTHPLTGQRLRHISQWLDQNGSLITRTKPDDLAVCKHIASLFTEFGQFLDDTDFQIHMKNKARASTIASVAPRRS